MQTKVQNMQNFIGYTKCGEILKPPSESYHRPFVLKCLHCKEIYLLFEAFIYHMEDHCKQELSRSITDTAKTLENEINNADASPDDMLINENTKCADSIKITEPNVKIEPSFSIMATEDPLTVVKTEWTAEDHSSKIKEEHTPTYDNVINESFYVSDRDESDSAETINELDENSNVESDINYEEEISDSDSNTEEVVKKRCTARFKKNSEISEFIKSRENVKVLISAYKNQPSLWNKNHPFLRHKLKRQKCLEQIAQELKDQRNLDIDWKVIANIIIYLCKSYREDLKALKDKELNKDGEKNITPSWYFDHLNFLRPFMENNLIAKLDSHLPALSSNQIIQILEMYKGFPHLWNTHLVEYYCKNKRYAAKRAMLEAIEANMGIKISERALDDYFRTVHNCFTRAKSKKLENKDAEDVVNEDNNQQDYYEHMIFLYDHVGKFKCSECTRSFKSPIYLKLHKTQLHGSDPLVCSLCSKEFKTANAYTNHAKRHMEDLNHECKECGKKFLHATDLRIHMRNHTGVKPFCCEVCGASFRHIQGFNNHRRRHEKNYLHTCHICNKGYYTKDRYKDHMNAHSNIRSQICNICGKSFITKKSLQQHVVIHEDIRRHACKLCGKTFKHKTGVNQHMRTHGKANYEERSVVNKE